MENKREKVLEKIKKLFALGNDLRGNEIESQSAILKAQQLMAEYGISHTDIQDGTNFPNEVQDNSITGYKNLEWWHGNLGQVISENFKCFCYMDNRRMGYRQVLHSVNFVGLCEDIKVAKEVFYYAIMMIEYHSEVYLRNYRIENPDRKDYRAIENKYVQGYLAGLKRKFEEQKEQNKKEWGLILVRDKSIDEYVKKELNLCSASSKIKSSRDMEHFNNGFTQGKNFNMIDGYVE